MPNQKPIAMTMVVLKPMAKFDITATSQAH